MKYMAIFTNWRITALTAILAVSVILLLSDSDDVCLFFLTKALGTAMMCLSLWLHGKWHGKMKELDVFNIE